MTDKVIRIVPVTSDRWRELRDLGVRVPGERVVGLPVPGRADGDVSEIEWRMRARRLVAHGVHAELALDLDGRALGLARAYSEDGTWDHEAHLTHFTTVDGDLDVLALLVERAAIWAAARGGAALFAGVAEGDPQGRAAVEALGFRSTGTIRPGLDAQGEVEYVLALLGRRLSLPFVRHDLASVAVSSA